MKQRFIVSNRCAGMGERRAASRENLDRLLVSLATHADITSDKETYGGQRRRIQLECEAEELEKLSQEWGEDVLVEPELLRFPALFRPGPRTPARASTEPAEPAAVGFGARFTTKLVGAGAPVEGAAVTLVLANARGRETSVKGTSDSQGEVSLPYDSKTWIPALLLASPRSGFWGWWQNLPRSGQTYDLPALPKTGPMGWWHHLCGMQQYSTTRGEGIHIGVVDTGVGPHPYLSHVESRGSVIGGSYDPAPKSGLDVADHGTHVSGILGARPVEGSDDFGGIASGAAVSVIRVFPPGGGGANQGDIAEAIEILSETHRADLINLSLGSPQPSQIELDAILVAAEEGTLCFAAAGNQFSQPILYPAAHAETVAVSAVGLLGVQPPGTISANTVPKLPGRTTPGGLYLADFSNVGPEMICTAPGVGIISTVPAHDVADPTPYLALDGTSMASPVACASLASLLAEDPVYRELPPGIERVRRASLVLLSTLQKVPLAHADVGFGLAQAWPG